MNNPIDKFKTWWQEALAESPLQQKSAVCVSTIDEQGFPTGRFVDLKSVGENGFVFCTCFDSAKGRQIERNAKTAITAWWDHSGYQVRIVGTSELITAGEADQFWAARNKSAQLTTTAFEQSEPTASEAELAARLEDASAKFAEQDIPRPDNWGGYCVKPISIEFLTFRESRLHLRELFVYKENGWVKQLLQP
ncbi:pyridoxine/pyridoxamine 5'-phosphate oxidase [Lacimicrobium alkaliphilum]|uniref:Pyridoxamine-phosphate oxidase n=1 Tax=Lacimicrobium alkaliphilum TaxID=1526571 RepID=A0A0U2PFU1_9ALTE|nr:pyridoxal 5'-phosphate synthase [Lacimicrobium alkaliphilum]ALS98237.1 pyridoxamine-phosphate oxidase [Lacimicrobium alkaliphilum]